MKLRLALPLLLAAALCAQEKRLIVHADDLGFSHAANRASLEMLEQGWASSGSVMMPCPWAAEVAAWARQHRDADLGLHLTLTSEWKTLRWAPVAPRDKVPGLLDPDGYLWPAVPQVATHATPQEVETELRAQIEKAQRMGVHFTHLDTHMGTLYARPDYFEVLAKLGREYNVPVLRVKPGAQARRDAPPQMIDYLLKNQARFEQEGVFQLDALLPDPTGGVKDLVTRRERYQQALRELQPGTWQLILHPAIFDAELAAATGTAVQRDGDYRVFRDESTVRLIRDLGIKLIGWKDVR